LPCRRKTVETKIYNFNSNLYCTFTNEFSNIPEEFLFLISNRASGDIMNNRRWSAAQPPDTNLLPTSSRASGGIINMSYTQLLYHLVIRTKANQMVLSLEYSDELYRYIWGIIRKKKCVLYRVNGTENHVHLLMSLHPTIALSDFMRDLKAETSKMLKQTSGFEQFTAWSDGYAALTYSMKEKETIVQYIKSQREHHKTESFQDEFIRLLREAGLELDERDWNR
jgi:REP element-mobilizing transposase RayT